MFAIYIKGINAWGNIGVHSKNQLEERIIF
jgi:hypothetical protein